ncbi:hypothetical protein LCGC14_2525230, partial [marine sediment metagenome]
YGRWHGFIDNVVWRYLDCWVEEAGFARLKCDSCGLEKLLTLSCKQRLPLPYIDTIAAEKLFAHKILHLLKTKGLLSDKRIELLDSFRHSGFSVDASPTLWPQDTQGLERLCRYLLRCPVSLSRIHWTPGSNTLFYESKSFHDDPLFSHPQGETLDILEFLARVLTQIPEPRKHGIHYFGA